MKLQTHLFFFIIFISIHITASSVSADDTSILLSIKQGLVDPLHHLQDWKLSNTSFHCNWTGITCNSNGVVQELNLSEMNLNGTISEHIQELRGLINLNLSCNGFSSSLPKSLSNLTSLEAIDVSQNMFEGEFPAGVGKIASLVKLNASSNNFFGKIPSDFGDGKSLEILDLRGNFFGGTIPKSFKNLEKLKFLGLSGNNLTGELVPELGHLASLETMIIGYNEFEGEIPKEFGNLSNLQYLDLAFGNIGGEIPPELGRLKKLTTAFLYQNNIGGKIPPEIGNITSLQVLDLSDNILSGELPAEMGRLENLQLLNLMCNRLSGSVPPELGGLKQLQVFELWNNSFSGPLPADLGRNSPLQWVDVSSNLLSGQIPTALCGGGELTKLILFNNAFIGPIPSTLSNCSSLTRVRIHNNRFSGTIPTGFGTLEKLQRLELANNNLSGKIPNDISSSTSLAYIDLSQNHLQSSLPSSILSMPNLQNFLAAGNKLVGEIPDQLQDCPSLSVLDLSSNHFTGDIPASIASCERLVRLDLHNNNITGTIPRSISMMPTLSVLDLSNNSLTGGIPESFGNSPALETLNVSYNKLEGPVPENGVLKTINPNDLAGNVGLCGGTLPSCHRSLPYSSKQKGLREKHIIAWWSIGILSVLAAAIAVFCGYTLYKRWYSNGSCFEERFEMGPWRLMQFQRLGFTSNDILGCIKESNMIGMGATGVVYKAEVPGSDTVVAVKKLWRNGTTDIELGSGVGGDDIIGEVNLLGKLRHRNIVRLLGCLHNDKDAMIVYEYMENGSLGGALHGKQGGRLLVDWVLRYNIAVGVAHGLAYLHHDCHPQVIHRDIKSNNILLDANLDARIADFGLAKMMIKKNETVSMVAGSYGYIAPEYGYTLQVDEKSDVYSYGVVLMELLTGKHPLDPHFGEAVDVIEWFRMKIRDNKSLEEALDPNMGGCKHVQEEMLLVLRIALLCTAKLAKERPTMRDVITMLGEAKPRRKSSSTIIGGNSVDKEKPVFSTSPVNGLL